MSDALKSGAAPSWIGLSNGGGSTIAGPSSGETAEFVAPGTQLYLALRADGALPGNKPFSTAGRWKSGADER